MKLVASELDHNQAGVRDDKSCGDSLLFKARSGFLRILALSTLERADETSDSENEQRFLLSAAIELWLQRPG